MPRGCKVFSRVDLLKATDQLAPQEFDGVRDIILHALFARIALCDESTVEFKTVFDKKTNTVELDFPDALLPVLDEILGMQRGPRFQAYIDWLVGRQSIVGDAQTGAVTDVDQTFIPATALTIWAGAVSGNIDDDKVVIFLPTTDLSTVGYNTKLGSSFGSGNVKVSLVWVYESGSNASFDIQTSVSVNEINGNNVATLSQDKNISTFNLIKGDIRETELIDIAGISSNDVLSIIIRRNYDGSPDPKSEFVGIMGIKVEPNG